MPAQHPRTTWSHPGGLPQRTRTVDLDSQTLFSEGEPVVYMKKNACRLEPPEYMVDHGLSWPFAVNKERHFYDCLTEDRENCFVLTSKTYEILRECENDPWLQKMYHEASTDGFVEDAVKDISAGFSFAMVFKEILELANKANEAHNSGYAERNLYKHLLEKLKNWARAQITRQSARTNILPSDHYAIGVSAFPHFKWLQKHDKDIFGTPLSEATYKDIDKMIRALLDQSNSNTSKLRCEVSERLEQCRKWTHAFLTMMNNMAETKVVNHDLWMNAVTGFWNVHHVALNKSVSKFNHSCFQERALVHLGSQMKDFVNNEELWRPFVASLTETMVNAGFDTRHVNTLAYDKGMMNYVIEAEEIDGNLFEESQINFLLATSRTHRFVFALSKEVRDSVVIMGRIIESAIITIEDANTFEVYRELLNVFVDSFAECAFEMWRYSCGFDGIAKITQIAGEKFGEHDFFPWITGNPDEDEECGGFNHTGELRVVKGYLKKIIQKARKCEENMNKGGAAA